MSYDNNKRLILNTGMLYIRMLVIMFVSLYTSRVTLDVLGVIDYGIYNIVAGVVVLFSFISQALNSACNRFLSMAVGKGETVEIQNTFSTALTVHLILMISVFILLELAGFYLFSKGLLNIPPSRLSASATIYHMASLSVCFTIVRTPFNASIIAHEDMGFYAYSSVVEAGLKLFAVYVLTLVGFDKLISYSIIMLSVVILIDMWYVIYCLKKYIGNKILIHSDRGRIREMLSFCGWGTLGGIADISWQQGTNLVLNYFFGVALNSAMGIANQIKNAVYSVSSNVLMAANPQIVKSYSGGDRCRFYKLVYSMSKFPYFLMLIFTIPLILNMDFVLSVWLVHPPEFAGVFSSLILIACNISILIGPLWTGIQAVGDIKKYNIVVGSILIMNVPVTYIAFKIGCEPQTMIYIQILMSVVQIIWTLFHSKCKFGLNLKVYTVNVILPLLLVTVAVVSITGFTASLIVPQGWFRLIFTFFTCFLTLLVSVYYIALNREEKLLVKQSASNFIKHNLTK